MSKQEQAARIILEEEGDIVPPARIDLLHRKPYQQTGPAWDRVRQQVEAARLGKSRHV